MTTPRKALLWVGLCLSPLIAAYASFGFVYFRWLGSVGEGPREGAALLSLGMAAAAIACVGLFVYCAAALLRTRREQRTS